jgi:hypothetical protein
MILRVPAWLLGYRPLGVCSPLEIWIDPCRSKDQPCALVAPVVVLETWILLQSDTKCPHLHGGPG